MYCVDVIEPRVARRLRDLVGLIAALLVANLVVSWVLIALQFYCVILQYLEQYATLKSSL